MTEELVAEVVEEPGTDLESPSTNLFGTTDPTEVLKRAMTTAEALMPVVRAKGLIVKIGQKDHLTVEAWQTLGAMLGVTPVCTWNRQLDNGWEARVEARTLDGRVIGAAEAECLKAESRWADADDYAVRSMAQTRATSKALASVLRFVATLGGASGTPAEEMDGVKRGGKKGFAKKEDGSSPQRNLFAGLLTKAGGSKATIAAICAYADAEMSVGKISEAIDRMKNGTKEEAKAVGMELGLAANAWQQKQTDIPADDDFEEPGGDTL